ncbi:hypothetical protein X777_02260, partial [Ooceraea biroi]
KRTGGRNATVVETATQLRQRLARYQPPTTDVNSYHYHRHHHRQPSPHPVPPRDAHPCRLSQSTPCATLSEKRGTLAETISNVESRFSRRATAAFHVHFGGAVRFSGPRYVESRAGGCDYITGRGDPSILGERHVSPVFPGPGEHAARERSYTAPGAQSGSSLVVGVRTSYLAPGTDLQSSSSPPSLSCSLLLGCGTAFDRGFAKLTRRSPVCESRACCIFERRLPFLMEI